MPTLIVTPNNNGVQHIGIFWYDRRLDPADNLIARYGNVATVTNPTSATSAITFGPNYEISNTTWAPVFGQDPVVNSVYMGDYDTASTSRRQHLLHLLGRRAARQPGRLAAKIAATVHGPATSIATTPPANVVGPIGNIRVTFNEPILTANNPNLLAQFS